MVIITIYTLLAGEIVNGITQNPTTGMEPAQKIEFYATALLGFVTVLSCKLLIFDVDDGVDMNHHPLYSGRGSALLWTLLNPIICAAVAIMGTAVSIMVQHANVGAGKATPGGHGTKFWLGAVGEGPEGEEIAMAEAGWTPAAFLIW